MPSSDSGGSPGVAALPDFDRDGQLNDRDIDLLCAALGSDDPRFDLNHDGPVDEDDFDLLVESIMGSRIGDANLDRRFDSQDIVFIFQAGEYEDDLPRNSGWAEGDWNCDGDFTSDDLVLAFVEGGYEEAGDGRLISGGDVD